MVIAYIKNVNKRKKDVTASNKDATAMIFGVAATIFSATAMILGDTAMILDDTAMILCVNKTIFIENPPMHVLLIQISTLAIFESIKIGQNEVFLLNKIKKTGIKNEEIGLMHFV